MMTEIITYIPEFLKSPVLKLAEQQKTTPEEIIREAVVDFILNKSLNKNLSYEDSDDEMLKNLMAATSVTLFQEENARDR
jgi:hypothetical protein